jgi:DNA-binding beta-propeller fold protein YncE
MKHLSCAIGALIGRRVVVAVAAASCAAACLGVAGSVPASAAIPPRAAAAVRLGGAGRAVPERVGGTARSGPVRGGAVRGGAVRGGLAVLGGSPGVPVADARTGTVYVPIQSSDAVDVIDAAACNARVRSDCRVVARVRVGRSPLAAAIDARTDTIYVVNGSAGTVSVLDGARCNARVTGGCGRAVATIRVGRMPVAAAFNPATRTVYVANLKGRSISVINAARCNAVTRRGCGRAARTVPDRHGPDAVDVDVATDTVYAANSGTSGNGDTVSVIDGAACNGSTGRGCGRVPRTIKVGSGAFWVTVDQASDAVYVANNNDGTVSVINGARCNSKVTSGCASRPPAVTTGASAGFVAIDSRLHTVFAINQGDGTLSAINTRTCNGTVTSGCPKRAPNRQAAFSPPSGYNPNAFALIPRTGTAYLVNVGGESFLSVMSIRRCSAAGTSGCRAEAPSAPEGEFLMSADPATGTIYGGNLSLPDIDVFNTATCNAAHRSGCTPVAKIPIPHPQANVGAIDHATGTLYASDPFSGKVSVISTASCNATDTAGCAATPPTITIGPAAGPPVLDKATRTLYVPYGATGNRVAVVNAATCNAKDTAGCGQTPAVVKVRKGTEILAVSAATDTIYAPNGGTSFNGDTVSVINGATCNGTRHAGCAHLAAIVKVGLGPYGVAVNDRTHTVYVANNADGDLPGTVSVINGATCNGSDTSGCGRHFPTMPTGRSPLLVAADTRTGYLYVTNFSSATVSVLNGSRCNAHITTGCRTAAHQQATGSQPFGLTINLDTNTIYAADLFQSGSLSIFRGAR